MVCELSGGIVLPAKEPLTNLRNGEGIARSNFDRIGSLIVQIRKIVDRRAGTKYLKVRGIFRGFLWGVCIRT